MRRRRCPNRSRYNGPMTTQDRFVDYGTLPTGIPRVLHQFMLGLNTAMPGEVVRYDAATRRADVRGQLAVILDDGAQINRPVISNVPVVFPVAADFAMTFPLAAGDSVLLVFSMRGLSRWKATHGMAAPDTEGMLSHQDAIAIPGFGPAGAHEPDIRITSDADGLTVQREDGERVRFNAGGGITILSAGAITITGGNVTIAGTTTVNGNRVASQPAGTNAASGTGSHSHGLTAA